MIVGTAPPQTNAETTTAAQTQIRPLAERAVPSSIRILPTTTPARTKQQPATIKPVIQNTGISCGAGPTLLLSSTLCRTVHSLRGSRPQANARIGPRVVVVLRVCCRSKQTPLRSSQAVRTKPDPLSFGVWIVVFLRLPTVTTLGFPWYAFPNLRGMTCSPSYPQARSSTADCRRLLLPTDETSCATNRRILAR